MIIKFSNGTGWAAEIENKTYLVTANNPETKFELYIDENGNKVYNDYTKLAIKNYGIWDTSKLQRVSPNTDNSYWASSNQSPQALVDAYNADTNRLPIFDGFKFEGEESNPTQFRSNKLIRFTSSWIHAGQTTNTETIYITYINDLTKDISFKELASATFNNNAWTLTTVSGITAEETALVEGLDGFNEDNEKWDQSHN